MGKLKAILNKNAIYSVEDLRKKCFKSSLSEIYELILSLYFEMEKNAYRGREKLTESVYLTTSAIGLSQSCASPECRNNRIHKALKSSLLLSDKIFIDNPLESIINVEPKKDTSILRFNYCLDLIYFYNIANLLETGILINLPRWVTTCQHCKEKLTRSTNKIEELILSKKKHFFDLMKDGFAGNLKFNKDHWELFYQGNLNLNPEGHPLVRNMSVIPNKLKIFKNRKLSFDEFIKFGHPNTIIHNLINNAILYLPYKSRNGLNAVVTNELEASVFNQLIMGRDNQKHEIPFISFDDINLNRLIDARNKQPNEFENFRKEINKVIKEIKLSNINGPNDKNKQLNLFIKNEISNNLNRLNSKIRQYAGDQLKKALQRGSLVGSMLGIGAYTGMLPNLAQNLLTASFALLANTLTEIHNRNDTIKNDNWYFYWQLVKR